MHSQYTCYTSYLLARRSAPHPPEAPDETVSADPFGRPAARASAGRMRDDARVGRHMVRSGPGAGGFHRARDAAGQRRHAAGDALSRGGLHLAPRGAGADAGRPGDRAVLRRRQLPHRHERARAGPRRQRDGRERDAGGLPRLRRQRGHAHAAGGEARRARCLRPSPAPARHGRHADRGARVFDGELHRGARGHGAPRRRAGAGEHGHHRARLGARARAGRRQAVRARPDVRSAGGGEQPGPRAALPRPAASDRRRERPGDAARDVSRAVSPLRHAHGAAGARSWSPALAMATR